MPQVSPHRTLYRAKAALGSFVFPQNRDRGTDSAGSGNFPKTATEMKVATSQDLATFEQVSETKPISSTPLLKVAKLESLAIFESVDGNLPH